MPNYQGPLTRSRKRKRDSESSNTFSQNKKPKQDSIWPLVQEQNLNRNLNRNEVDYLTSIEISNIRTIENPESAFQDALDYIKRDRDFTQVGQKDEPGNDIIELNILDIDPSLRQSLYEQTSLKEILQEDLDAVMMPPKTRGRSTNKIGKKQP